jgi:hypothetical protein
MRDGLTQGLVGDVGFSYGILALWTLGGWLVTWRVLGQRG